MSTSKVLRGRRIFLYQFLSLGIYFFFWCNRLGKELSTALRRKAVPSMWWFILPGGAYYWMWRMSESLDTATAGKIKQADIFLLYILFTCALFGGGYYGPDFSYHSDGPVGVDKRLILTILVIVLVVLFIAFITLHAIFMSIVQGKINKVRGR